VKNNIGNQGFVKGFLSLLLIVLLAYIGISFGKPYYRYYTLGSHTRDFLKMETGNIQAIREKILSEAADLKINLKGKDLEVSIVNKIVKVRAKWSDTVDFGGYYTKKLYFVMEEDL